MRYVERKRRCDDETETRVKVFIPITFKIKGKDFSLTTSFAMNISEF